MKATNLEETPHATWRSEYILPYESVWSIRHKYCVLNAYGYTAFTKAKIQYTEEKYKPTMQIPVFEEAARFDKSLFVQKFRFCPECLKRAYHSRYHQLSLLDHCFIHHETRLIQRDAPYTEKDHCYLHEETFTAYQDHVVEIIDNRNMRDLIIREAENIDSCISCLRFFDFSGKGRDRQFGNNHPLPSTVSIMEDALFHRRFGNNAVCVCEYPLGKLRALKPFPETKLNRVETVAFLTSKMISERLLSADARFWVKERVDLAEELVDSFDDYYFLLPAEGAKLFFGFRNVFCWLILCDIFSFLERDPYGAIKRSENAGGGNRIPQHLAFIKKDHLYIFSCRPE